MQEKQPGTEQQGLQNNNEPRKKASSSQEIGKKSMQLQQSKLGNNAKQGTGQEIMEKISRIQAKSMQENLNKSREIMKEKYHGTMQ